MTEQVPEQDERFEALEGDDVDDIRKKTEALQEASHKLAEAVYAKASAAQAGGSANGASEEPSDDEVIEDAEVVDEEAPTS